MNINLKETIDELARLIILKTFNKASNYNLLNLGMYNVLYFFKPHTIAIYKIYG